MGGAWARAPENLGHELARVLLGLWLAGALCAGQAAAQSEARVLWLEPGPAGALERVRGQLSDLAVGIEVATLPAARTPAQLDEAAAARGAALVLWAEPLQERGLRLHVYVPEGQRAFERDFSAPEATPGARSAAMEALAVGARSAVLAVRAGEPVGAHGEPAKHGAPTQGDSSGATRRGHGRAGTGAAGRSLPTPGSDPSAEGSTVAEAPASGAASAGDAQGPEGASAPGRAGGEADPAAPRTAERVPTVERDGVSPASGEAPGRSGEAAPARLWIGLAAGWRLAGNGFGPVHGPLSTLSFGLDRWSVQLGYLGGLARQLSLGGATLELREHRMLASLRHGVPLGEALELGVAVGGGLWLLTRETLRFAEGLEATAQRTTASGVLQAGLGLCFQGLALGQASAGVELEGALQFLPAPLALRVRAPAGTAERRALPLQPAVRLGLFVRWPGPAGRRGPE